MSRDEMIEPVYRTIINNSRYPDDVRGDLDAEIMACRIGVARVRGLLDQYGAAVVEELLERCARALHEVAFPKIPDGEYPFEAFAGSSPRRREILFASESR